MKPAFEIVGGLIRHVVSFHQTIAYVHAFGRFIRSASGIFNSR